MNTRTILSANENVIRAVHGHGYIALLVSMILYYYFFFFYNCSYLLFFCYFYARYFRYVWWRMRFHYSIDINWHLEFMVPGQMDRILQIYDIVHVHFGLSVNVNIFGAFISILLASLMSKRNLFTTFAN